MNTTFGRRFPTILLTVWLLSLSAAPSPAENWPQFRGPRGDGISADPKPPVQWSDAQGIAWKTPLPGPGSSSPIIWGERVFVTCYSGYGVRGEGDASKLQRHLLCLDRKSGAILWRQDVPLAAAEDKYSGFITEHGYASQTPVTDGQGVYVFFGKSGVLAFDMAGKKLWQTSVGTQSSGRKWGSAASPVLYKNTVIVVAADESRTIRALDKATGKEVWNNTGNALELVYNTPLLAEVQGGKQELLLAVPNEIWSLDPDSGKCRWYAAIPMGGNISPGVVADKDTAFAFGGYPRVGAVAVQRGGSGKVPASQTLWTSEVAPYVPTPVLHEGRLYWLDEKGRAVCMDAKTGKVIYREQLPLKGKGNVCYASVILAGGKFYAVTRTNGTIVYEPGDAFRQVARNLIQSDDSDFSGSPAFSDGQIFLRSGRFLYCIGSGK